MDDMHAEIEWLDRCTALIRVFDAGVPLGGHYCYCVTVKWDNNWNKPDTSEATLMGVLRAPTRPEAKAIRVALEAAGCVKATWERHNGDKVRKLFSTRRRT